MSTHGELFGQGKEEGFLSPNFAHKRGGRNVAIVSDYGGRGDFARGPSGQTAQHELEWA
jgi:hypothetical protein